MNNIKTLGIGLSGIAAMELSPEITESFVEQVPQAVNLIMQILIGISTLFGLFRKKSK